jgi:alkanesulfonate monooxygenase SsuD/methylene tetrahydromethanopterin reductase-like flavin-dependent oxidoreductase (luciferase family)
VDFDGRYYQLREARCEPKPVQQPGPPLVIGGSGEKLTLRVAAQHADIWNSTAGDVETFRHKVGILHEHCAAVGRDPNEIELSIQHAVNYADVPGTVESFRRFVDAGATHLVLNLRPPFPAGVVDLLVDELIPRIRA